MFIPNVRCKIKKRAGTDLYGKSIYGPFVSAWCGIVRLEEMSEQSSVRADSSASRGSAMEGLILSRILLPLRNKVSQGDVIQVLEYTLTVQSIWPRFAVAGGRLDHYQVDAVILVD